MKVLFEDFIKSNRSGGFLVNPFWLEYLLCLLHQGYVSEIWEEIQDTKFNCCETIEIIAYSTIAQEMRTNGK